MGVRIGGVWHEELPDPGSGGSDSGNGRNYNSMNDYNNASGGGSGGGQGGAGGQGGNQGNNNNGNKNVLSDEDRAALQNYFGQTAGFSREELAERVRQFNEQAALIERQWTREGLPRLEIDQRMQALREWQAQQDVQQQRGSLGLQYLQTAANMGGPADYFQQADFLRGARSTGDVPQFLNALNSQTGGGLDAFSGAGLVSPTAQSAGGIAGQLGGTGAQSGGVSSLQDMINQALGRTSGTAAAPAGAGGQGTLMQQWLAGKLDMNMVSQLLQQKAGTGFNAARFMQIMGDTAHPAAVDWAIQQSTNGAVKGIAELEPLVAAQPAAQPVAAMSAPQPVLTAGAPAPAAGTSVGGYNVDAALQKIGSIFQRGPTGLQPGTLEKLDPDELALMSSGAKKLGFDPNSWLRAYQRAGVGQAAGAAY